MSRFANGYGTVLKGIDLNAALAFLTTGQGSLGDALVPSVGDGVKQNTNSPIHNYSVPGIRTIDMGVAGYGQLNGLFGAFMSGPTATVLGDAVASNPSFFSLWPGGNDLLGYALGGGSVDGYDPTNTGALTDPATFSAALNGALSALTANGSHGIPHYLLMFRFGAFDPALEGFLFAAGLGFRIDFFIPRIVCLLAFC